MATDARAGATGVAAGLAGAVLTVDLDALQSNYRLISERLTGGATAAAVVKADAYGIGIGPAARALWAAGARDFFVAHPAEGIALRDHLADARIHVLGGAPAGAEEAFLEHGLIPALNCLGDVERWRAFCARVGKPLPCVLHVDTGMCRLGLDRREYARVAADPSLLDGVNIETVMSHLASADEDSSQNAEQLAHFREIRKHLAMGRASFANSSGVFLGPDYHFDLARPGVALYGVNPTPGRLNPTAQVVRLQAKILQVRDVDSPETVGYGATHRIAGPSRIATLPVGYADGYLRSLSNRATAYIGDFEVPLVGRVSMDLITIDVTGVPEAQCRPGAAVDLIGPRHTVDDLAAQAGTIGYEILTSLGRRYHRAYVGGNA
ncbi:MAG: alanine racemase [Rhodospirillales bacterium CG15_BIG_FIL_POST_REV_8_21_14_020_66_15]|nr:MAG: alanine racemase [Rhodospirillales bacterium CG15_BIG_FIL_POST_REV_8_21_14_020_66_15]